MKYIRFVALTKTEITPDFATGVITRAAYILRKKTSRKHRKIIRDAFKKFNEELECPSYKAMKKYDDAISWFKITSNKISLISFDFLNVLEKNGLKVVVIYSNEPGKIVYEDEDEDQILVAYLKDRSKYEYDWRKLYPDSHNSKE